MELIFILWAFIETTELAQLGGKPQNIKHQIAEALRLDAGIPVLRLEDDGFNFDHEIIVHSTLYLAPGKMQYKILQAHVMYINQCFAKGKVGAYGKAGTV